MTNVVRICVIVHLPTSMSRSLFQGSGAHHGPGIVQELTNVAANQILTITEPAKLVPLGPSEFQIRCWKGMQSERREVARRWDVGFAGPGDPWDGHLDLPGHSGRSRNRVLFLSGGVAVGSAVGIASSNARVRIYHVSDDRKC